MLCTYCDTTEISAFRRFVDYVSSTQRQRELSDIELKNFMDTRIHVWKTGKQHVTFILESAIIPRTGYGSYFFNYDII